MEQTLIFARISAWSGELGLAINTPGVPAARSLNFILEDFIGVTQRLIRMSGNLKTVGGGFRH
jgi:hypothetical protein